MLGWKRSSARRQPLSVFKLHNTTSECLTLRTGAQSYLVIRKTGYQPRSSRPLIGPTASGTTSRGQWQETDRMFCCRTSEHKLLGTVTDTVVLTVLRLGHREGRHCAEGLGSLRGHRSFSVPSCQIAPVVSTTPWTTASPFRRFPLGGPGTSFCAHRSY